MYFGRTCHFPKSTNTEVLCYPTGTAHKTGLFKAKSVAKLTNQKLELQRL